MKLNYDLIIVGNGVTGGVFSALIDQFSDLKIAIVEAQVFDKSKPDPRVFAITRASEQIFRSAGIWSDLETQSMGHFREMEVWEETGAATIHFDSKQICEPTLGYIIENRHIQTALTDRLNRSKNIDWLCPAKVEQLEVFNNYAEITLDSGKRLKTKLVVGADGNNSRVRELISVENKTRDYRQSALVCSVKTQIAHKDVARQRFLNNGPLAFLPLADPHMCSIVWSTLPEHAQHLIDSSDQEFHRLLELAFEEKLGSILDSSQRFSFPLTRAHVKNYVSDRVALIGDAAHRIHPLAGQGANLGILDAAALAEIIQLQIGHDPGRLSLLRKYERWRKGENLNVIATMDAFKYLFESDLQPLQWLRSQGLNLTNSLPFAKRQIMQRAMGLSGDLPESARMRSFL